MWFKRKNKIGEDLEDNLPTKGKRYYMSHTDYAYKQDSEEFKFVGGEIFSLDQLVCASNMENARKAVEKQLGDDKMILGIRIDYLIVGK